ncbi:adult cuticle protein 1-like [Teleopsis dalmanni]|uniref:adult cuticle protein 1-like n=1 Tax=Teleopsis dalmanni TaxID=139649 RepID=UPI000D329893|nr:adult cuticle protein 1-like [Teleopsis dalmanni]
MKFFIAAVFTLALAMGAQSSLIPLAHTEIAGHGLSYTAVQHPAIIAVPAAIPAAIAVHAAPAAIAVHAAPAIVHTAAVVVPAVHEGSYIAKTRGAIHHAPLAGHISSAAAINVAPAPGTH